MSVFLMMPGEMAQHLAQQLKANRLAQNLTQKTLAERSGVSASVLKKFERSGKISLESLLKLALTLGCLEAFYDVFTPQVQPYTSLKSLTQDTARKRGRK